MRISDWSSDVCSSVLFPTAQTTAAEGAPAFNTGSFEPEGVTPGAPTGTFVGQKEIGRASCRERVVSVRVDPGGRRSIKKKTERSVWVVEQGGVHDRKSDM